MSNSASNGRSGARIQILRRAPLVEAAEAPASPSAASDRELMEGVRAQDERSLGSLVERYWPPLVHYATDIIGSPDEAKDVVQEAFLRVWNSGDGWMPTGSVSGFLYKITRNLALNRRRDDRTRLRLERAIDPRSLPQSPLQPDDVLAESSLREEVETAIAALPARRREVFVLSRFHGLSYTEVADALGLTVQTVANQMSSALSELRERLGHRTRSGAAEGRAFSSERGIGPAHQLGAGPAPPTASA